MFRRSTAFVVVGALAMAAGCFLMWARFNVASGPGPRAIRMPLRSLYRPSILETRSWVSSPGTVVVVLSVLALLGLIDRRGVLTTVAGIGALAVVVLVGVQIESRRYGLTGFGAGIGVSGAGALLTVVGSLMRRREARPNADQTRRAPVTA